MLSFGAREDGMPQARDIRRADGSKLLGRLGVEAAFRSIPRSFVFSESSLAIAHLKRRKGKLGGGGTLKFILDTV